MAVETTDRPIINFSQIQQSAVALAPFASDAAFVAAKGTPAASGDSYFNTTDSEMHFYSGSAWKIGTSTESAQIVLAAQIFS